MNELETLKQVVTLQGEMIKELLADVQELKGKPLETPRMYAEDMDWKEGEEEENTLLRHAIAFKLPRPVGDVFSLTDLEELGSNLCNNKWLRQKAISVGVDVSHIKETV